MSILLIETIEHWKEVVNNNDKFYLLKHSLTCPISARAKSEYEDFSLESKIPLYILHVQETRDVSNKIADEFNVKHESPQVLLVSKNTVVWHDSHHSITKNSLLQNM